MKKIIDKNSCEICGEIFDAEFIQHDSPLDDYPGEKEWVEVEELTYPHKHYQPTVSCMICPNCRP